MKSIADWSTLDVTVKEGMSTATILGEATLFHKILECLYLSNLFFKFFEHSDFFKILPNPDFLTSELESLLDSKSPKSLRNTFF